MHIQLAQEDGSGLLEPGCYRAVEVRDELVEYPAPSRITHALDVIQVLQAHRDAMQRALVGARLNLLFRLSGLRLGLLGEQGNEGVEGRLGGVDARQMGLDGLDRRDLLALYQARELAGAHVAKLGYIHQITPSPD